MDRKCTMCVIYVKEILLGRTKAGFILFTPSHGVTRHTSSHVTRRHTPSYAMWRRIGLYFNASVLKTLDGARRRKHFQCSNVLNFQSVRLQTLAIQQIRSSHVIPQHETRSKKTMENTDERLICEVKKFNCLYNQTRSDYKDQKKKENSSNVIGEACLQKYSLSANSRSRTRW